ncbi:hypothetical protein SynROS8604_00859 [Synechococcus sp. ROS8604]|nr:hypothetical protein SynROS8604_00859 [Synechococcus sp. ROS8604]
MNFFNLIDLLLWVESNERSVANRLAVIGVDAGHEAGITF